MKPLRQNKWRGAIGRGRGLDRTGEEGECFLGLQQDRENWGSLTVTQASDVWNGGPGNCHSVGGTWSVVPDRGRGSWGLKCAVCGPIGRRGGGRSPRGLSVILHFAFIAASQLVMANEATLLFAHLLRLRPRLLLPRSEDPVEDDTPVVHQGGN